MVFQFTHPGKGATGANQAVNAYLQFQFTHPGKGATCSALSNCYTKSVSIHAPWEGCDSMVCTLIILLRMFQFTHPGKGATKR